MSLFPPCPVALGDLIQINCENGRLHHLSLCRLPNGRWQASFKRPDTQAYKVHIAGNPGDALERVLGPDYSHAWSEVLGDGYALPEPAPTTEDDIEDLI